MQQEGAFHRWKAPRIAGEPWGPPCRKKPISHPAGFRHPAPYSRFDAARREAPRFDSRAMPSSEQAPDRCWLDKSPTTARTCSKFTAGYAAAVGMARSLGVSISRRASSTFRSCDSCAGSRSTGPGSISSPQSRPRGRQESPGSRRGAVDRLGCGHLPAARPHQA